ncbi:MAG: glycosyltransferase family 2 protein [Oscillospiraceae bacterium]|nr:glycosyltransferase family 2 protein [Oscillospiraceae bacterium]MBQ6902574.1 glycosyltransferase family 2 protein [Oscillospiraceae bacterium]
MCNSLYQHLRRDVFLRSFLDNINLLLFIFFTVLYSYQLIYVFVSLLGKKKAFTAKKEHKFAVIIAARNERVVIAQLIESIKKQRYPSELCDIYVIADNCTDDTAEIARAAGATVFCRDNKRLVGKGYALNFGFKKLVEAGSFSDYDGFFVFDADNLLDENYIAEMNKVFDSGYRIVTSYRNSKNYDTNWISAGSSLWFLREAKYINASRMILNSSCAVSGTGFLVSREIIENNRGWQYYLLTEDIEFSIDSVIKNEKIGYAENAMLYDEQPYTFRESWNQRIRWAKGFFQVFAAYGGKLFRAIFKNRSFAAYDMLMTIMPAMTITLIGAIINSSFLIYALLNLPSAKMLALTAGIALFMTFFNFYVVLFFFGAITTVTEWHKINSSTGRKILYMFTFPLFIFTYIPISIVAIFKKIEWKPIHHSIAKNIEEFQ